MKHKRAAKTPPSPGFPRRSTCFWGVSGEMFVGFCVTVAAFRLTRFPPRVRNKGRCVCSPLPASLLCCRSREFVWAPTCPVCLPGQRSLFWVEVQTAPLGSCWRRRCCYWTWTKKESEYTTSILIQDLFRLRAEITEISQTSFGRIIQISCYKLKQSR